MGNQIEISIGNLPISPRAPIDLLKKYSNTQLLKQYN